jgi:hypothetical protein
LEVVVEMSARSQELALLALAGVITLASNGYFQENDIMAVIVRVASAQQIFLLFFQFLGQYKLLSFTRDYARTSIHGNRLRRKHSTRKKNMTGKTAGAATAADIRLKTQPNLDKYQTELVLSELSSISE